MRAIVVNGLKSNIVFVNGGTTGNDWWPIMREGLVIPDECKHETAIDTLIGRTVVTSGSGA